jgi:hypothetical protein
MSEIRATTISDLAGTGPATLTGQSAAKAWLQYLQAAPVVSASFGVSSVTDNSTGNFTVNYTNAFSSDAHSRSIMGNSGTYCGVFARSSTNTQFLTKTDAGTNDDTGNYGCFHGDLA